MLKKHDDDVIREAVLRHDRDAKAAARELGYKSHISIYQHMRRLGIPRKKRRIGDSHQRILDMSGTHSAKEIADAIGHHEEGVRSYMKRHNIPRLPAKARMDRNHFWSGGRTIDRRGYVLVKCPDHPNRTKAGYVREHRLVMEQHLGRLLRAEEVVHHIDCDRGNNSIGNLRLYASNGEHLRDELTRRRRNSPAES